MMNKEMLNAIIDMLAAEVDYGARDLTRPLNEQERAVLSPPHPADFGIPKDHWEAARSYAQLFADNYMKAIGK